VNNVPADQDRNQPSGEALTPLRITRFDLVQRVAHWSNALLFGILMLTALPLYFSSVESLVGRHLLIAEIHLWAGLVLPVPLVVSLLGPWGARMRRDIRRISRWTKDEVRWLWRAGWKAPRITDKFNPGQKINAIFVAGAMVVMLGTGLILKWFNVVPVDWRQGATFVHEVLAFAIFIVVIGHIGFAVTHRDALRAMVRGWVPETWARKHAPGWLEEEREADALRTPKTVRGVESRAEATAGSRGDRP
jgi:formate dehydrogenase subunit gamma